MSNRKKGKTISHIIPETDGDRTWLALMQPHRTDPQASPEGVLSTDIRWDTRFCILVDIKTSHDGDIPTLVSTAPSHIGLFEVTRKEAATIKSHNGYVFGSDSSFFKHANPYALSDYSIAKKVRDQLAKRMSAAGGKKPEYLGYFPRVVLANHRIFVPSKRGRQIIDDLVKVEKVKRKLQGKVTHPLTGLSADPS